MSNDNSGASGRPFSEHLAAQRRFAPEAVDRYDASGARREEQQSPAVSRLERPSENINRQGQSAILVHARRRSFNFSYPGSTSVGTTTGHDGEQRSAERIIRSREEAPLDTQNLQNSRRTGRPLSVYNHTPIYRRGDQGSGDNRHGDQDRPYYRRVNVDTQQTPFQRRDHLFAGFDRALQNTDVSDIGGYTENAQNTSAPGIRNRYRISQDIDVTSIGGHERITQNSGFIHLRGNARIAQRTSLPGFNDHTGITQNTGVIQTDSEARIMQRTSVARQNQTPSRPSMGYGRNDLSLHPPADGALLAHAANFAMGRTSRTYYDDFHYINAGYVDSQTQTDLERVERGTQTGPPPVNGTTNGDCSSNSGVSVQSLPSPSLQPTLQEAADLSPPPAPSSPHPPSPLSSSLQAATTDLWHDAGFLGFPAEVRNDIYEKIIGPGERFEIKELEVINPAWIPPFSDNDCLLLLHRSRQYFTYSDILELKAVKNAVRAREGRDRLRLSMPDSMTAWQFKRWVVEASSGRWMSRPQAALSVSPVKKWCWGNFDLCSSERIRRFNRLVHSPRTIEIRRAMDDAHTASERLAILNGEGNGFRGVVAMGMTCRQVSVEFLTTLYQRTAFSFSVPTLTSRFFARMSAGAFSPAASIREIHLQQVVDISPRDDHIVRNARSQHDWEQACRTVARMAPNISRLDVTLDVRSSADMYWGPNPAGAPPGFWDEIWDVYFMERATWFQPLKAFRSLRHLQDVTVTYQPDPYCYRGVWTGREQMEAAFSRLLLLGPDRLMEEYESGSCDWFLCAVGKATWQRYPIEGPLTKEDSEALTGS